jgi:glucosamine 6-phosphate synthetase-like amidotransferase/phosphosugar isomerase protein
VCGIGGYIGQSKNQKVTYELITHIFNHLETRGTDAAGIYGIGSGKNDAIIYHKEPVKSSEFIKLPMWAKVQTFDPSVLLVHARATSPNGGHAKYNKNNHPFVSADRRIGLVHNGNINEIDFLKKKYQMFSECDSEILLRMYEATFEEPKGHPHIPETPPEICIRMKGIQDMWSVINRGAMAVAIAERVDADVRYMFLFRNDKRPLWLADMRDKLGQIFFFSSVDIWFRAIKDCKHKQMFENQKLVELPEKQVWYFRIDGEDSIVTEDNFMKFNIELKNTYKEWKADDFVKIQSKKVCVPIVTELDNEDEKEIKTTPVYPKSNKIYRKPACDEEDTLIESYQGGTADLEDVIRKIEHVLGQISTQVTNAAMEGSLTEERYQEVIDSLEQNRVDLEGTYQIVKHY